MSSAEVICVGTELLLGDILNTNCQYLAKELANLGIPHYYQTVVGDNVDRLQQVIKIAIARSSILIFTGGLGPTPDDLTTETIANFFNVPLIESPEILQDISQKFAAVGREMTPSNHKQALIPQGAQVLPNPTGTAPGIIWQPQDDLTGDTSPPSGGRGTWSGDPTVSAHRIRFGGRALTILTFPGVPSEMHRMWRETAVPFLKSMGWGQNIIYSQMMRFRGIGESALAEKVAHLFESDNPTVAPYASQGEVRLRISAKAKSEAEAIAIIEPMTQKIKQIAGIDYFGSNEDTLASVVGELLNRERQTLSIAESCTGGGLGAMLTDTPGSSDYFLGGVIAYADRVKTALLDVNELDLQKLGAVSATVAEQMALGVKKHLKTDWGLSITGIAGPGGDTENKPVGLVYIGIANPYGRAESREYRFGNRRGRLLTRHLSACNALDLLRRKLLSTAST